MYLKAENALHTTRISSFKYACIVYFDTYNIHTFLMSISQKILGFFKGFYIVIEHQSKPIIFKYLSITKLLSSNRIKKKYLNVNIICFKEI